MVKRRLREIGRRIALPRLDREGVHVDLLIRARQRAYQANFATLEEEVTAVVEELCSRKS